MHNVQAECNQAFSVAKMFSRAFSTGAVKQNLNLDHMPASAFLGNKIYLSFGVWGERGGGRGRQRAEVQLLSRSFRRQMRLPIAGCIDSALLVHSNSPGDSFGHGISFKAITVVVPIPLWRNTWNEESYLGTDKPKEAWRLFMLTLNE